MAPSGRLALVLVTPWDLVSRLPHFLARHVAAATAPLCQLHIVLTGAGPPFPVRVALARLVPGGAGEDPATTLARRLRVTIPNCIGLTLWPAGALHAPNLPATARDAVIFAFLASGQQWRPKWLTAAWAEFQASPAHVRALTPRLDSAAPPSILVFRGGAWRSRPRGRTRLPATIASVRHLPPGALARLNTALTHEPHVWAPPPAAARATTTHAAPALQVVGAPRALPHRRRVKAAGTVAARRLRRHGAVRLHPSDVAGIVLVALLCLTAVAAGWQWTAVFLTFLFGGYVTAAATTRPPPVTMSTMSGRP